jgi:transposase
VNDIIELKREGLRISEISAMVGSDRKTVRKYLALPEASPQYGPREPRPGKLNRFEAYLQDRCKHHMNTGAMRQVAT